MSKNLQNKQIAKLGLKLSRRQIIVIASLSVFVIAAGLTILFNFSRIEKVKAGTSLPSSFSTGFENGIGDWTSSGSGTWSSSTSKVRSGSYSAKFATPDHSAATGKLYNTGNAITVPSSGTYYITVLVNTAADNSSGEYFFGLHDKTNNNDNLITSTYKTSTSWGKTSYTFSVTDGVTYYPFLGGDRGSNGSTMNMYFDDFIMYISGSSKNDETAPTAASNLNLSYGSSALNFSFVSGTDTISGIDGALIIRTNKFTQNSPTLSKYTAYSPTSTIGPNTINSGSDDDDEDGSTLSWTVVSNGSSATAGSDTLSTLNGKYTYLIYMRDKAYNYSATPIRAYAAMGISSVIIPSQNNTIDALYIASGASITQPLSYTLTLTNGLVDGIFTNYNIISIATGGKLTFSSTGTYYHQAGKGSTDARSIPTATWQSGSTCVVNGYPGYNLAMSVGGLSQNFSNLTWNCTKQTATSTISGASIGGKLEINSTGTSSLILSDSLKIGGDFKQTGGTFNFSTSNSCLVFNGSANQNYTFSSGTQSGTENITLNNNYSLILKSNLSINGILTLSNGTLDNSSYTYTVPSGSTIIRNKGSIKSSPTFSGSYNLYYTYPCTTGYELTSSTSYLHKLVLKCTGNISLSKSITVNDTFALHKGTITLDSNIITLACTSNASYYSSSSYVVTNSTGYLTIKCLGVTGVTTTVWFPVGSSSTSYTPAAVKNTGTLDAFSVRVYDKMYNKYTSAGKPSTDAIEYSANNVRKTWLIEEGTPGGSNATVYLQWNALDEANGFDRTRSYIAHYTSSAWQKNTTGTPTGSDPYSLSLAGITTFSPFGVGDASAALPVELTSFTAKKEQNNAMLEWNTASEINNDHFEVQRSVDGSLWENLASISGHGTTNTPEVYDYLDHDIEIITSTVVYYRLKQVDYDGKFEYSPIAKLNLLSQKGTGSQDYHVWYNPSDKHVYADVANGLGSAMQATLINIVGQTIQRQYISPDKQQTRLDFDASNLANGVYSVIFEGGGNAKAIKIIKN